MMMIGILLIIMVTTNSSDVVRWSLSNVMRCLQEHNATGFLNMVTATTQANLIQLVSSRFSLVAAHSVVNL